VRKPRATKTPLFGALRVSIHMLRHIFTFMTPLELEQTFPFISRQVRSAVYLYTAQTVLRKQIKCSYTALGFLSNDTLGYGVNLTHHHSSSSVNDINTVFPTLLSTAAIRAGINSSAYKQPFSHWVPVYINPSHGKRSLPLAVQSFVNVFGLNNTEMGLTVNSRDEDFDEKEMSLDEYYASQKSGHDAPPAKPKSRSKVGLIRDWNDFATGRIPTLSTDSYDIIMKACGKLCNSTIVGMMKGDVHESIEALVGYFRWVHLFLGFCERDPGLLVHAHRKLQSFVDTAACRSKDCVPALGELLPFGILLGQKWLRIVTPFLEEAFVRNARWVIAKHPEMGDLQYDKQGPSRRSQASFEANIVSLKLFAFHCTCTQLLQSICTTREGQIMPPSVGDIKRALDLHFGTPTPVIVSNMQSACKRIKSMDGWATFFKSVQLEAPSPTCLFTWLRKSVSESQKRGYHSWGWTLRKLKEARRQKESSSEGNWDQHSFQGSGGVPIQEVAVSARLPSGYPNPRHRN